MNNNTIEQLSAYSSEAEDNLNVIIPTHSFLKNLRKKGLIYEKIASFTTKVEAENTVKAYKNQKWIIINNSVTEDGKKIYYGCKTNKNTECPARLYLLLKSDDLSVVLFEAKVNHIHQEINKFNYGLSLSTKLIINELFDLGITKPKKVLNELEKRKIIAPMITQIRNYLHQLRIKKYGPVNISLGKIKTWCQSHSSIPDCQDEFFIGAYDIEYSEEESTLRFLATTKRLLTYATMSQHIAIDATYKLIWQGYPVFVFGTTDYNKAFHPYGISVCLNEKFEDFEFIFKTIQICCLKVFNFNYQPSILLADGSDAITKGFESVFGSCNKRIMCWAHVIRNIDHHLLVITDKK